MSPRVLHARDLGPVQAEQPVHGITLVLRRSEAQEIELQQLIKAQQDPASPTFHQWLTPQSFGQRFGMAAEDLDAVERWILAQGFTVSEVSRARDRITFSGTAQQVAVAFSATLHRYQVDGAEHISPSADLSLPADLAAVTTAVLHLSDFRPEAGVHPAYSAAADQSHFLTPGDLAVMYDIPRGGSLSSPPGTGQTIAIVGQSYVDISGSSRVRGFSDATETQSISSVLVPGTGAEAISPGDAAETEIDLEYAGGIVPAANLLLVHVGSDLNYDVFDALAFSIDQNVAPVISISYGLCEALLSATELQQGNALFQQATVQGQTLVAASGDSGSTGCVRFGTSSFLSTLQQQALAVGYPADSPYVTAVGGTQMAAGTFAAGETTYWAASTFGFDLQTSLLSYVPEVAWNEGNTQRIFAGGGGASSVFSRPTWQSGLQGITEGVTRLLPDVALQASSENPGFLLCTDDASFLASEGQTIGCFEGLRGDNGQFTVGGGTSFGAPVFAAMTALINQQQHTIGQGNVNPTLYGIAAKSSTDSSAFHDIVSGSIACFPGAPRCSAAGQSGFSANAGYDEATGLGSIDFGRLAAAWPSKQGPTLSGSLIQVFPQNTTSDPGATDGLSINVSPDPFTNGTAPTGSVLITLDGVTIAPALALSPMQVGNSTAEYVVTLPSSPGSHVIVVTYPGDATHGPSSAAVSVLVGDVFASGGITVTAGDLTVPRNSTAATTVTVTPSGGYNGRLFWSLSLAGADNQGTAACYFIPDVVVQGITTTTLSLGSGTVCSTASAAANASFRALPVHHAANTAPAKLWGSASIATAVLGCFLLPLARRRSLPILCMLLISIGGVALSGCGGGSNPASSSNPSESSGGATPAPTATTYTATLTGRDSINGVITSSATFALTLQ